MPWYNERFIQAIPKTDIHVHLDGSLRIPTLIELARDQGVELPSATSEGLCELLFKEKYANLNEYLRCFAYTTAVLCTEEALERSAYELAEDNISEGVRYLELRFAPQLHIRGNITFEQVVAAVDRGLRRKQAEFNASVQRRVRADVEAKGRTGTRAQAGTSVNTNAEAGTPINASELSKTREPEFEYGIIVCAMRFFNAEFSPYYESLSSVHSHSSQKEIMQYASMELARAAVALRQNSDVRIVAFDLAGSEHGYPASTHARSFQYIHENFLNKTVHAGEAYGPESIFQAITNLHADRIGHGLHLFNPNMISDPNISDKQTYLEGLQQFIADKRITLEVCLTSNMQTSPNIAHIRDHSLGAMLEKQLSLSLCTDNRLVSHTSVSKELSLALSNFPISPKQLKNIIMYGFKRSFFYHNYARKRSYVRKILGYYERMEEEML